MSGCDCDRYNPACRCYEREMTMTTPEPTPRDVGLVHTITELINEHDDFPTDDLCARIIAAVSAYYAVHAAPDEELVVSGLSDDAFFALREKLSRAADDHLTHLFGDGDRGDVAEETINAVLGALTVPDIAALAAPDEATVERVAEAIHGAYTALGRRQGRAGIPPVPWEELDDATRENNRFIATLALGALAALPAPPSLEALLGKAMEIGEVRISTSPITGACYVTIRESIKGPLLRADWTHVLHVGIEGNIEQAITSAIAAAQEGAGHG